MKTSKLENLRLISLSTLLGCNFIHLIWTIWLCIEQAKTGWGYGTNIELGALFPWIWELVCIPALLAGAIYIILALKRTEEKKPFIISGVAWVLLLLQIIFTNLFIFM